MEPDQHSFTVYLWVFGGGLGLGLIFALMAWNNARIARGERNKFKMMLGEKLEIEASSISKLKSELDDLRKQNENLRIKVSELNQSPEKRLQRELEVFSRAEKRMVDKSPGFPAAWESSKRDAHEELLSEESGQTLPRRFFQKFVGTSSGVKVIEHGKS